MKKYISIAALIAAGSTLASAANELNVPTGGNFYAGSFTFDFILGEDDLSESDTRDVLALYWGTYSSSDLYSNGFILNYDAGTRTVGLSVGDGKMENAGSSSVPDIAESTTFESSRGATFEGVKLTVGEVYTITVNGANTNQTVVLSDASGDELGRVSYNGNMYGGNANTTMVSVLNSSYNPYAFTWNGGASGGQWNTLAENKVWDGWSDENQSYVNKSYASATFGTQNASVEITENIVAGRVNIDAVTTFTGTGDLTVEILKLNADVTFAGTGSLTVDTLNVNADATVAGTGSLTVDTLNVNAGATLSNSCAITVSGALTGNLTKSGEGTMTISGNTDSYTGLTTIKKGRLEITNAATGKLKGSFDIQSGAELYVEKKEMFGENADFTLTLNGGTFTLGKGTRQCFGSNAKIALNGGTIDEDNNGTNGDGYGAIDLVGDREIAVTDNTTVAASLRLRGNTTFNVYDGKTLTLSGIIDPKGDTAKYADQSDSTIIKTGAGSLVISGNNLSYNDGATINAGVLVAQSASALGTGAVKVSGGQLEVDGVTITNAIEIVLANGSYVDNAALSGTGTLSGNITVRVADMATLDLVAQNSYKLWDSEVEVKRSDDITCVFEGLDTTQWSYGISNGTLTFSSIPEPSAFGLLAGIGALALVASRRRRK